MKKAVFILAAIVLPAVSGIQVVRGQWNANGNNIYNTNTGNVGIGTSTPSTLLYVAKNITEPTISIRNPGGFGGATYAMKDDASGADWKFKATLTGGFKIRDNANSLDVLSLEPNSRVNSFYIRNTGSIGIGTSAPDNSAILDLTSVNQGFQVPQMTSQQIGTVPNPANGLLVYCTTDDKFYIYIASSGTWNELLYGTGIIGPPFVQCGNTLYVNHVAGNVAPVTKTVGYRTVTNIPGELSKCWITSNLGASNQASAVSDATEPSAGWYWQFNRAQGYKNDGSSLTPSWTLTSINENSDWQSANDPCALLLGTGWRLPTSTEWNNVDVAGTWTDWNGPWNSVLKLHAAGYLMSSNGALASRGSDGQYWSTNQSSSSTGSAFFFGSGYCNVGSGDKAMGFSVRCIQ